MVYNKEQGKCVCANNKKKCQRCQSHEFLCNNNICIDKIFRCNGVDDCGDYSDEKCSSSIIIIKKACQSDQYHCPTERKCIKLSQVCDGREDCTDKSDEKNCDKYVRKCSENQFECDNNRCIGLRQVCDGQNDCGDHSDEINCHIGRCNVNEAQCDDGECIPSEYICDGKFHCKDFSDERACIK
ncbi:Low-density lipoprotein receptor-related protein 1B [Thelohanellus kitauei]|uniref:Low-density lipoprotein receptor-related protein 1B n=1 Tax=Thelohanellus kitauei TaxID=669202 RepID=A0A0C2MMG8_THEKT|nr:Low-density lipoprotein receptor-related protein 1B [Thelohanellus kitauei]